MALRNKSLFLYGFQVTENNSSLDFIAVNAGPTLMATLNVGFYSLSSLCQEIVRALQAADPDNTYSCTADRTADGGLGNRVRIATDGTFLSLPFLTGPRAASSCRTLIGFTAVDRTGATFYISSSSSGIVLVPSLIGYNFRPTGFQSKVAGVSTISASGLKESIVFQMQRFWQVEFKYEPESKVILEWEPFRDWMIQQRLFEFTPDVTDPATFYDSYLEKTKDDSKGMALTFDEMLPMFPFQYTTGLMTFRQRVDSPNFI